MPPNRTDLFERIGLPRSLAWFRERFDAVFFAPTDARSVSLFRTLYCGSLACSIALERRTIFSLTYRRLLRHPELFQPIHLFARLRIEMVSPQTFAALYVVLLASLIFASIGLATRWTLTASWIAFFFYYGTIHSSAKLPSQDMIGHRTDAVIFILLILSASPAISRWGVDMWMRKRGHPAPAPERITTTPAWPLQTAKLILALAYFGAGCSKVHRGFRWADGRTLQAIFLESAMQGGFALSFRLAHHHWLCMMLSVLCLMLELTFAVVLFFPDAAWVYVLSGLAMHVIMQMTMGKGYLNYFGHAYWVFLDWPAVQRILSALAPAKEAGRELNPPFAAASDGHDRGRRRSFAAAFILLIAGAQLACIFFGLEAWPFTAWKHYGREKDYTQAIAYRPQAIDEYGRTRWLDSDERQGGFLTDDSVMNNIQKSSDLEWVRHRLDVVISDLPMETSRKLKAVALIKRTARREPNGEFVFVDSPFLQRPVGGLTPAGGMR